jgi:hypothetical protein
MGSNQRLSEAISITILFLNPELLQIDITTPKKQRALGTQDETAHRA